MKKSTRMSWGASVFFIAFMIVGEDDLWAVHGLAFDWTGGNDTAEIIAITVVGLVSIWTSKLILGPMIDRDHS
ncbi:MAG: hypothetical protein VYA17_03685 [Pseudomonadota bacterium]|nr:hypothetical protein [Pseudomonadota bacterium]